MAREQMDLLDRAAEHPHIGGEGRQRASARKKKPRTLLLLKSNRGTMEACRR
jgi:hypothetical protein